MSWSRRDRILSAARRMSCRAGMSILHRQFLRFLKSSQPLQWMDESWPKPCRPAKALRRELQTKQWKHRKNFRPGHGNNISQFRRLDRQSIVTKQTAGLNASSNIEA